ncbi:MAG: aminotransferase DegT [Flavobacteriales bacterium]|nr:aminotransferase DegT [Flavobacteriales bacterium]
MNITIPLFKVFMSEDVLPPVNKVLMSGSVTQGAQVEKFEKELTTYLQNPYTLTLNSATSGLTLALRLLINKDESIGWPGFDESNDIVLTPALTCFATTASILANRVNIRWLDVDLNTANICLEDVRRKLNQHTKVIYLVHWGGTPVDMDTLADICNEHKEKFGFRPMIVEDCAHAFGAEWNGTRIGSLERGNICVFSTQAIKHLTTGDGGIITLPNETLYERCKLLRWYGIDREKRNYKKSDLRLENDILEYGYKFHMNDINATIGLYNLPHMDRLITIARDNAKFYDEYLKDIPGVRIIKKPSLSQSAYWLYTLMVLDGKKSAFIDFMKKNGVFVSQVHNRNDINTCTSKFCENLPNLNIAEQQLVCIPVGWWVTNEQRNYIVHLIKDFV